MKPHPAAAVFPTLGGAELEALIRDIDENGQIEPIVEHHDTILDGNSRFAAYLALGGEPIIEPWDGECGSPVAFVISRNIRRRHLSPNRRAWIISELTTFKQGSISVQRAQKAEENTDLGNPTSLTTAEAAEAAGVDVSLIQDAKVIREHGTEEEKDLVAKGESGLRATADKVRERKPQQAKPKRRSRPGDTARARAARDTTKIGSGLRYRKRTQSAAKGSNIRGCNGIDKARACG